MLNRKDLTIIIRSSGERTVPVIWNLLKQQVSEEQIFEVNEVPNSRALKKSFEIANKENREWLLLIDGDILPFRKLIDRFLQITAALDNRVFCIQCSNIDKMMRIYRPSGVHLYRTSLIERALELIPGENKTLRPESTMMSRMEDNGYPTLFMEEVLALHDFEQYYKDLYRKGYFCAHKFTKKIPYLKELWTQLSNENRDYEILLEGMKKGENHNDLVVSNVEFFEKLNIPKLIAEKGISEKPELEGDEIDFDWIDNIYRRFEIPVSYYNSKIYSNLDNSRKSQPPIKRRFLQLKGKIGVWKIVPWIIGSLLEKIGRTMKPN